MLLGGLHLATWTNVQVETFNAGLQAYEEGNMEQAKQLFEKSLTAYKSGAASENAVHDFFYPAPDRNIAACFSCRSRLPRPFWPSKNRSC